MFERVCLYEWCCWCCIIYGLMIVKVKEVFELLEEQGHWQLGGWCWWWRSCARLYHVYAIHKHTNTSTHTLYKAKTIYFFLNNGARHNFKAVSTEYRNISHNRMNRIRNTNRSTFDRIQNRKRKITSTLSHIDLIMEQRAHQWCRKQEQRKGTKIRKQWTTKSLSSECMVIDWKSDKHRSQQQHSADIANRKGHTINWSQLSLCRMR